MSQPLSIDRQSLEKLREMLTGYRISQLIVVAAKLNVADKLIKGPLTIDELAASTCSHAPSLYRVLRTLASIGIFREISDRRFELTPLAEGLRTDVRGSVHGTAVCYSEGWWWDSWGRLYDTVKTGETAFDRLHGMGLFDYLQGHPDAENVFAGHMASVTDLIARAVVDTYDFSEAASVCDVGGGNGVLLREILRKHAHLQGVLFDQVAVVAGGKEKMAEAAVLDRCQFVGGDFFDSVPAGADIYLLKNVIHDWDDVRAARILRNCRRAMPRHAKLLVIDFVIPPANQPSLGKIWDMTMMVIVKGIERTEEEHRRLLQAGGFKLGRLVDLPIEIDMIEALPV